MERRRTFIKQGAALSAAAAAGTLGFPAIVRGQSGPLKVGILHPVTGPLAYSGQLSRLGAQIAIEEINAGGGIKSLGAKIEPIYGDAQSKPDVGVAEVEKMNEAGVSAIVGAYASAICLATTQAAARHNIPHVVDVGVADQIVERGLKNTFRFGPGYKVISTAAMNYLHIMNKLAGNPAKTVMIIHEESLFGTGTAGLLQQQLPAFGFKIVEVIKHANPTRDFNNIVLRMKSLNPDVVIPANYYNEYALLVRTMKQQGVQPQAIFSVLGGAASSFKFVKEFPDVANGIIDVNHWYNPKDKRALALRKKVEGMKDQFFTYEVFLNYECVYLLADAIERAKSTRREAIIDALGASTWDKTFMPYGPTKFVNGQNQGAEPLVMQVVKGEIEVILPNTFAQRAPIFPWKGRS
ncbi:MAG TPA: ABC transporter substrate-binding protein [Burkholderiales bacterium]|nr:ABC transporter substrate-binding protein [Burkholderiales bacterium]